VEARKVTAKGYGWEVIRVEGGGREEEQVWDSRKSTAMRVGGEKWSCVLTFLVNRLSSRIRIVPS